MKKLISLITAFIKAHRTESFLVLIILIVASYMRLHDIAGYMTFLGDEGRDAIIVRKFLVEFDLMFIGPGTSIGNMYLGPLYYYLMAPAMFLANLSPVGPAVLIALMGVATVWFVWYVARVWFPREGINTGALIAAFLFAISPTVIIYSRSSWNPNIMPFFAILSVFSLWKVWMEKKTKWMIVAAISMAFVLQSHYLGLLLGPVLVVFWALSFIRLRKEKNTKQLIKHSIVGAVIFFLLMSPLLLFDIKNEWINYNSMKVFFTERQTTVNAKPWKALPNIMPIREEFLTRIFAGYDMQLGKVASYGLLIFMTFMILSKALRKGFFRDFWKGKIANDTSGYIILATWAILTFVGLGVYKQEIYDHYYGFFYVAPFLVSAGAINYFLSKKKSPVFFVLSMGLLIYLGLIARANLAASPLKNPPNMQFARSEEVSQKMIDESGGEPFNIAVIAERNYEGAYQYYLERHKAQFVIIDPQRADDTITSQLFVVCELPKEKCDPTHNDKAEVANFGWSAIADEWNVAGVTLYRLVHTELKQE